MISKAKAQWNGGLKRGTGTMSPAHVGDIPYSFGSRFEGRENSNPEELIGAALAGCYSMALASALEAGGMRPESIRTSADVTLEKRDGGFAIANIALVTHGTVPGADRAEFMRLADDLSRNCVVAKALTGTKISVKATVDDAPSSEARA